MTDGSRSKPAPTKGVRHFIRSCGYSMNGLKEAFKEAAFRQELLLGLVSVPAAWLIGIGVLHASLITAMWFVLLAIELLNTAVESVVDLASPEYHELAKRAKDLASAAVTCGIAAYLAIWLPAIIRLCMPKCGQ